MRRAVGLALLVVAAAACGGEDASLPENAGGAPRPPGSTTTVATTPEPAVKQTPECLSLGRLIIAQGTISFATPDQAADLMGQYEATIDEATANLPQFADNLATIARITRLEATGEPSAEEAAELSQAFAPLEEFNRDNCLTSASPDADGDGDGASTDGDG